MNANVEKLFQTRDELSESIHDSIVELIPGPDNPTPLVRVGPRFNPAPDFELLVKLEGMNPFGSIKDRTAWFMLKGLALEEGQSLVEPTAGSLQSLMTECAQAFMVTELLGQGANTVTGTYSRGAAGYWIERGEIAYPVSEVTIAGQLSEMFERIAGIGNDIDLRGTVRCGSVLVEGLTVAGQSAG